ncbi:hypothetical protein M3Y98_00047800 [Aphelenchoides besseyi]|nr:hypothetical protein M3Y98_00047800 [Aphelenchoides besseyi]
MRFPVFLFYLTAIKASQLGNNYQLDLLVTSEELPRNVRVNRYDLQLNLSDSLLGNVGPNLPRRFKGEVKIEFVVVETLSTLRLNAVNLSVHEAKLYDTTISNTTQMALDVLPSSDLIGLTAQLQVGQTYIAVINYEGQLGTEKNGFYYVAYPGENGQQKSLIATVFEPNYARQMLPCLDDLHFKAQFSLRVIAPKELAVFFNTMEMSVEHDEFNQFIVFETTPPMSTYLLALVVGEYRTTVVQTRSGIPASLFTGYMNVRAASTLEQSRYLQRAAEIGAQSVDLMEQMTGLLFSMKKLDLIDIREISLEGALEDWGAIVFSGILSSIPSSMTVEHEQDRASTIAHEVSHAWWGDMVTSDKWNEIFLHESFASFFQMRLMQQIDGDAEWIESKFVQFRETGLNAAEQSGKALISKESNFGAEIYMGGSSILRMIEATVGPQTFINALRLFLQEHAFATANHLDLIRAFEKATGNQTLCGDLTIREFLLDFFLQSYFPVVNIDLRNRDLSFSQHSPQVAANSTARWNVPIFIWNSRDKVDTMIWLLKNNSICSNDRPAFSQALSSLAVVFNHRALTYARFKYPSTLIDNILSEGVDQLDDLTLLGLLQDSALTPDGLNIFVNLMRNGKRKFGAEVAYSGLMLLSNARKLFYQTNELVLFEKLESEMVTKLYEKANWEPKTSGDRAYSNQVMREAVRWGVLDSRAKASLLWSQLVEQCASLSDLERCNSIPADLRNAVVCFGILDNQNSIEFTFAYWTRLLELAHVYTFFNNELINVESGLLCAEDPIVLERILKVAAENDRFNLISILSKPVAYNLTMRFLREAVTEKQRTSQQFVLNVLSYLAQTWNTENQRQSLQEILSTIVRNLNPKQRDFLVESLNNNIQRRNQLLRLYTRWLYDVQVLFVDDAWNQQQLRPSIQNVAYDLNLQPYIPAQELQVPEGREGTFDANSKISFVTTSSIDRLVLNSHRQMINQILATIDGETFPVRFDRDYNRTLLTVYFGRQIPPNTNVELSFEYSGFMAPTQRDQHHGVILQPYYNTITKRSSHLLTVQLSGGANPRSLLPCIDNSDYKAIWRVRIRHSRRMIALANSPVESIKPTNESEYLLTEFQPTTPTATLIFSVTVGDFQSINGRTEDGIEVRFYASEGFEYHGRVALEAAIATLDFLSKELNFRYVNMNTKLDLVAFPHFYGSMENSACIVLRDSRVLFDGMSNTLEEKRILLRLWFGDLLSIRHWREMFMGEGFAKFYESEVYEHLTGYGVSILKVT